MNDANDNNNKPSFWSSVPGMLTGLAALLGAVATLMHLLMRHHPG